ncbi:MAG: 4-hydroxy-tetrahydrodipicolinate synthase [Clostridia bacterium]|nr:4-hydroxy-tetrahydrodipicolinate synthase [Clostridia bacterium]
MKISGNYTALITPFKKNGNVDFQKLEELIDFQIDNQTDGIVLLGATAEAHLLDGYEKRKIMQCAVKKVGGKVPIIAGLTQTATDEVIYEALARFVDGADALLVCTPSYIKPTQNGLVNHFKKIADESYLPIIIYNNPSRTGVNLEFDSIKELSTHPNIIGIKEASTNFSHIVKVASIVKNDFTLICGNDEFLLPLLSLGATASISVIGNIMPDLVHDVINTYHISSSQARETYQYFNPIINALSLAPNPTAIKYIMQKLGMIRANLKSPLCLPEKSVKKQIDKILTNFLI